MSDRGTYGSGANTIALTGTLMTMRSDEQVIQGSRVNSPEIDRLTRKGQQGIRLVDFQGGLAQYTGIGDVRSDLNKYALNQGLITRIPGALLLPFNPTLQTSMTNDVDVSAFTAAGKRLHSTLSALNDTALRWFGGIGTLILGDTSSSDPALKVRATALTNTITAIGNLYYNGAPCLAFATDGDTDDIRYTTDVSGTGNLSLSLFVAYSSGDRIDGMDYFPELGNGVNIFFGKYGGVTGWWYRNGSETSGTALSPIVYANTKDIPGNLATLDTGYLHGTRNVDLYRETTDTNIFASDDAYGTGVPTAKDNLSSVIFSVAGFPWPATTPRSASLIGLLAEVEAKESAADDNIDRLEVKILKGPPDATVGGGTTPESFAETKLNTTELGTVDAYIVFGSFTDPWLADVTMADFMASDFWMTINPYLSGGTTTPSVSVDDVRIKVYYQPTGTQMTTVLGGNRLERMPNFPNRMVSLEPRSTDVSAITQPRRLVYTDFTYDADIGGPVGTKTYPDVGNLANVHHGVPIAGGYAITGGPMTGPGELVFILREDGKVVNTRIPATNGGVVFKCTGLFALNGYLGAHMVSSDNTNMQDWYYDLGPRGGWFTDTVMQTLLGTQITTQPLVYAETALNLFQSQSYVLWPASTHIGVRRDYVPSDMNADPRLAASSITKFASAISLSTMNMFAGYADASNTLVWLEHQERAIGSSASATGTVKVEVETGGDSTFASPAVTTTFTSGLSATVASRGHYDVPTSGVAYQTLAWKVTLDQGSGTTTAGPNGVPILNNTVQDWAEDLLVIDIQLERIGNSKATILKTLGALATLKKTKNVQPLKIGDFYGNAVYDRAMEYSEWLHSKGAAVTAADAKQPPVVRFIAKPGTV